MLRETHFQFSVKMLCIGGNVENILKQRFSDFISIYGQTLDVRLISSLQSCQCDESQSEQKGQCAESERGGGSSGLVTVARPTRVLHLIIWNRNIIWTRGTHDVTDLTHKDKDCQAADRKAL